jgi:hypothetical protein
LKESDEAKRKEDQPMATHDRNSAAGVRDSSDLDVLIADVISRIDRNEAVDMEQLVAAHPEHARELSNFFSFSQELSGMMRSDVALAEDTSVVDQAMRSTTSIDSQTVTMLGSQPAPPAPDPRKIGKYEVLDLLGAGSFGRVYLGYDPLAKRKVAIKVPRSWDDVSEQQQLAFLHEAQSAAALRHEHIVRLLDVYQGDDVPIALIYEHIPGPSMHMVLKHNDFQRDEAMGWIADIADALNYAHRNGIVHRDIKPSNILLTDNNGRREPRIVDFGLALLNNEFWWKGDRSRVGALRYMSPEQAKSNSHWATAQADVFSLGVVLYEVLCGRSPWTGTSESEMLREIEERDPAPPRVMDGTISPELERICLKAMAKSSAGRYTTAGDMARDLRAATRVRNPKWRNRRALAGAAAVVALFGLLALVSLKHQDATTAAVPVPVSASAPAIEAIPPQEVHLDLRIQPLGKPGAALALNDEIDHLQASDRLQINAQVPQRGYLYVVWYRPDGQIRLLDDKALATSRLAIQEPPVDEKTAWEPLGKVGGEHLIVAFTKPTPLSAEEADVLKRSNWHADTDWLGSRTLFRTGHPRTTIEGPTRGAPPSPVPPAIEADRYLGELGTILKYKWGCYFQAVIFRVN